MARMVAPSKFYSIRASGELLMQLTSDHLDLADQAAHELHDQQLLLSLWNSYDPNLYRTGKFLFSVDSKDLRNSIRATQLHRRSPDHIWIEIDSARLKCVASTKNCTFECSAWVSLSKDSAIGSKPIRIEVRKLFLANFCEAFEHGDKVLEFEFDENEKCLVYTEEGDDKIISSIRIPAERRPMPDNSLSTLTLYDVPEIDMLRKAIDYVGPMSLRKAPDDFPCRGIQFAERTAFGAYRDGASKFHSSRLPDGQFNLPKKGDLQHTRALGSFPRTMQAVYKLRPHRLSIRAHELLLAHNSKLENNSVQYFRVHVVQWHSHIEH